MISLSQTEIARLLVAHVKANGTWKEGTYNQADPTHCERGSAIFYIGAEPGPIDEENGYQEWVPITCTVAFNDYTWGIQFTLTEKTGSTGTEKSSGYISGDRWTRVEGSFERMVKNVFQSSAFVEDEDDALPGQEIL